MALAALASAGAHRLRYLITAEGTTLESVSITTVGTTTPDTLTDCGSTDGTIKKISKVVADGYGLFAAGVQTQAKARTLWCSDAAGAQAAIAGNPLVPLAQAKITPRTGAGSWIVDANVSANNPVITVSVTGGGTAYLDLEVPGTIGV
jgi:hypothetical protein